MKQEQINEGYELIASFMKWKNIAGGIEFPKHLDPSGSDRNGNWIPFEGLQPEWNVLLPVIRQIQCVCESPDELVPLQSILWFGTIDEVFKEVVGTINSLYGNEIIRYDF